MNKILLAFLAIGWMVVACEEVPPPVSFSDAEMVLDTSYVRRTPAAAQDKNILIEDLTGVRCVNCPEAAIRARELKAAHPDRVHVAGLYSAAPINLTTPYSGTEDLRTDEATLIYSNLYGSPPMPNGGVNRKQFPGQPGIVQSKDQWGSRVESELTERAEINLEILNASLKGDSLLDLQIAVQYNTAFPSTTFVSIMLLENDIEATQSTKSGEEETYVHEHVLRAMYTPYNGAPMFTNAEDGRYLEASWELEIPSKVDLAKASVLVLLNRNEADNKEVIQCQEVKIL